MPIVTPSGRRSRRLAVAALIFILVIFALGFEVAVVPTSSMESTILAGDHLLIDKLQHGPRIPFTRVRLPKLRQPRRGEVVSLRSLRDPELILLKRVVAVGGDSVEVCGGAVFVPSRAIPGETCRVISVPRNYVFVLGDNRGHSEDSRNWGPVPAENVIGSPVLVLWSYAAPRSGWLDAGGKLRLLVYLSALAHPWNTRWSRLGTWL